MDEMRQLVSIMQKLMPESVKLMPSSPPVHSPLNRPIRVSEPEIREYLRLVLGTDAPQPVWGLPKRGRDAYLSELFTWSLAGRRVVSPDEAMRCIRRPAGKAWEVLGPELRRLGLSPDHWTFPLDLQQVSHANLASNVDAGHPRLTSNVDDGHPRPAHHGAHVQ